MWQQTGDNPNAPSALRFRQDTIDEGLRPAIDDRIDYLVALASGKRVLDVGIVDHISAARHGSEKKWLHREVARSASYCLGIDVLEKDVLAIAAMGFNVRTADVTSADIDESFDVIVAGEVIEHLSNPAGLFETASRCLRPGGKLVISTPNPFYANRVWFNWRGVVADNVDHVALFWPSGIAELSERSGLQLRAYRPVALQRTPRTVKGRVFVRLRRLWRWLGMSPLAEAETIVYEIGRS